MKNKLFFSFSLLIFLATMPLLTLVPTFAQGVKVVVIDPGHGGIFPGATYNGVKEKELTLAVALKLGAIMKAELPHIKVVYTRTTDTELSRSLAQDLHARTLIANNASGDLFISIHANAASSPSAYGTETILMGETSVEQQRNEAALYTANKDQLLDMSNEKTATIVRAYIQNLQFTYGQYSEAFARLIQKNYGEQGRKTRALRYQLIKVLYGTDMPCALTEIGFMTNPKEFAYMTSQKGQNEIARAIFNGIKDYVDMVNKTITTTTPPPTSTPKVIPTQKEITAQKATQPSIVKEVSKDSKKDKNPQSGFTIQILSSNKPIKLNDSIFKNFKSEVWEREVPGNYRYKYCVGKFSTQQQAKSELKRVQQGFKDAFITSYK
ncbi:MAG: N-acetylmuramoyl-L-alanine amidase [Rikenellaceae bacterium]